MNYQNPNHEPNSNQNESENFDQKGGKLFAIRSKRHWSLVIILACLILITVSGCLAGANSDNNKSVATESVTSDQSGSETASAVPVPKETANANAPFDASKIIYAGSISLSTENYQTTFDKISSYAVELGGFVQDSGSSYVSESADVKENSGYLTIRVPSGKFIEAMTQIQTFGNPISSNVSSTNISQQYQDIQTQINNLKIEEARLLEYLKQATNITDMLAIETELNRVRTEIDSLTSTIKNWDTEMAYSSIYVSLYQKQLSSTIVNSPFSEIFTKIGEGFITSINLILTILAFLVVLIFRLIPFVIIAGLVFLIFIKIRKKIKEKKNKVTKIEKRE
ncbi:MAG: DUF4349 domain-containing protein [Acetobacterium woodii]|nr:DUF4349 domain-containing protein [Acetobacterium woodii]